MAVPKRKTTRSKRNKRRSHHAMKPAGLVKCSNCGSMVKPHIMCPDCGHYGKKQVKDARPKKELKKEKRKATEKRRADKQKAQKGKAKK